MPQEQTNREKAGNTAGILTALLLFVCIISVAYYTWFKNVNPSATPVDIFRTLTGSAGGAVKDARVQFAFDYDSKENPVFSVYGDYIAKCSIAGIWLLDKKGQAVWSESMALNKPVIKTNGSRLLVADIGASDLFVVDGRSIRWRERLDASILNADISEDGYVSVIVSSKRYNSEVRIFDPYGIELFRTMIANDFAVNASVSPSERSLAVSGINTGACGAFSSYKFYDLKGKELTGQTFEKTGELLPLFWFNGDGSLFAAGDRAAASMDKTGKIIWVKQFTSVTGACMAGDKNLAVTAESNGGVRLHLYDAKGKETSSGSLFHKPRSMTAIKGAIALFADDTVNFYNDRCKNISRYSSDSQIRQVFFFSRQQAAVVTNDSITVININ